MKNRALFVLFIVFVSFPQIVFASEEYEFISDVISSFEISRIAGDRIKESENQDYFEIMKDINVFANEIRQANSFVERLDLAIISDDAGQFNVLLHALCWIHTDRSLEGVGRGAARREPGLRWYAQPRPVSEIPGTR